MKDAEQVAMMALIGVVLFVAWQVAEVSKDASAAMDTFTGAASGAVGTAQGLFTGTVGSATQAQMDRAQYTDILRAGGTQAQAQASVTEMDSQIAPELSGWGYITNALSYWFDGVTE